VFFGIRHVEFHLTEFPGFLVRLAGEDVFSHCG
jgi:hypothetical protein